LSIISQVLRPGILACCALWLLSCKPANAQSGASSPETTQIGALPDAPHPVQEAAPYPPNGAQAVSGGNISGTVTDTEGDVLQGVEVTLLGSSGTALQTATSGANGQFQFAAIPPGSYTIKAGGQKMSTSTSDPIQLGPGEYRIAPTIKLSFSGGVSSITVTADKEELAEQQVHIAEQQRVAGVIPNFFSAFDWNAPPMMAKQKFKLTTRALIDPVSFLAVAGIAGAEQYKDVFPAYGSGIKGYGKRYGAALANRVSGDMLGRAVYPSIFHQDPRYFYKGTGTIRSRALYAISRAVVTRSDDGRLQPNYSQILGNFSAGALSNLYYPTSDRGASLVLLNGLADSGANAVSNLVREFLLKSITTHVPDQAASQP